jgi:hypothetical protein
VFSLIRGGAPQESWDVRAVLAARRRRVLAGASLVFSRVIPLETDPRAHPLWRLAEQFGAACGEACGEGTTHVVATHGGTEKVGAAARAAAGSSLVLRRGAWVRGGRVFEGHDASPGAAAEAPWAPLSP